MMKTSAANQTDYYPQLDSLRFFAVLGVIIVHTWHPKRLPWILGDMDTAGIGVRLFFVLSGFLITGILLRCRELAVSSGQTPLFFIRQFYARRFLRIFPIYYLVILVGFIFAVPTVRETWPWLVSYTTNFYVTFQNKWPGYMGHFWTLAVEEHFYLVWPWLVLFAPRKWLLPILLLIMGTGPAYRAFAYVYFPAFDLGAQDFKAATLTPGSLDILGAGALLALLWNSKFPKATLAKILTWAVLPASVALLFVCLVLFHYRIKPSVLFVLADVAMAGICTWLVHSAGVGFKGIFGKILMLPPFVYLGKISYGMYVYHNLMPLLLIPIFSALGIPLKVPGFINFILSTILTIVVSSLSWQLIELPINNLKRYFRYESRSAGALSEKALLAGEKQ